MKSVFLRRLDDVLNDGDISVSWENGKIKGTSLTERDICTTNRRDIRLMNVGSLAKKMHDRQKANDFDSLTRVQRRR